VPTPRAEATPSALPDVPPKRGAEAFAGHLDRALVIARTADASSPELQRAGEFHQLAVRDLAAASDGFRRRVMASLDPANASLVRGQVEAAAQLRSMTAPQRALPRWRIVAPPAPTRLQRHYREAERRTGVPWRYLAAIHLVETRMGRIRGTSTAGAQGPMQFLPSTWDRYGAGGDIENPRDAILGAARLLKANGAPGDMATALWHYNPSQSYVRAITQYARSMQRAGWLYRSYWHWRVLYRHARGTYVLPVGYPKARAVLLPGG
jgi:membrane-bound lytic murein transglycosylase B